MFRLFCMSVLLALTGCATSPVATQVKTPHSLDLWHKNQQQLSSLQNWAIRGRVALFVDDDVYNLGMDWTLNKDQYRLKLEAALGQGVIQINKADHQVKLSTSQGEHYYGDNAEQVLLQSTGWSIPVEGLEFWIKGINHPGSGFHPELNSQGRATSLQQDGWKINFLEYITPDMSAAGGPALPHKIYMKRRNLGLKIVIDQWQPPQNIEPSPLFPAFPG